MHARSLAAAAAATVILTASASYGAQDLSPGAAGAGDPYYPLDGNGGYDVSHYGLVIDYEPGANTLAGVATISAVATQGLSRFNLDLDGFTVRSVTVDGSGAEWTRNGGELVVTPDKGIKDGKGFTVRVVYDGVPVLFDEFGGTGVIPTDDGAQIQGEPHVASGWFPVNDHPTDKASYTVRASVPQGVEAIGNGALVRSWTSGGRTTWVWNAPEPMASYLATLSIGQFDVSSYTRDGLRYWDAIDPDLFAGPTAHTGSMAAYSQQTAIDATSYKRLTRTIAVPAAGGSLSFWVDRKTEEPWDYFFVEAHAVGSDGWTTLPDANGHTSQDTGFSCPYWHGLHPFLAHYQTDNDDGTCSPTGTSGAWWAATGDSGGWEPWRVDLSSYAGTSVEVSLTVASDDFFQALGVFLDDVTTPTGAGSTSFEGGDLAGWTVSGAPVGSGANENDWEAVDPTALDLPTIGESAQASLARQPEIIAFLASRFGRYPFATAGGVVDDYRTGFALENQTRPVYDPGFFDAGPNDGVVVHEIAHQWYGDSVAVHRWRDIWLNEGFASYAEWLWGEHDDLGTADETFDFFYGFIDASNPFWDTVIGEPGAGNEFVDPVYVRGAMTLHVLRLTVGDDAFFTILRRWASQHSGGNGRIEQFIGLAERVSGRQLDDLFDAWLFTSGKPALTAAPAALRRSMRGSGAGAPTWAARQSIERTRRLR